MKKVYWTGHIGDKDDFGKPITDTFIDGKTALTGQWGIMNEQSWRLNGVGRLGTGSGQKYQKQDDGRWLKVEG